MSLINHFRTLLVNAVSAGPDTHPGEEYVPEEFVPVVLLSPLARVRRLFFGADPDRLMLNYRAAQLLAVVHATPLVDYVRQLDPRITYTPGERDEFADNATFAPAALPATNLSFAGSPVAPDATGRAVWRYTLSIEAPGQVAIAMVSPQSRLFQASPTWSNGLSTAIDLPGSGYSVRLATETAGSTWAIDLALRPQKSIGLMLAEFDKIGDESIEAMFPSTAPATFENAWRYGRDTPLRFAAVICALVYATEARRTNG